jgi:hypothetical protein
MSGDVNEARKLLAEKALLHNAELAATERHLDRLREGRPETIGDHLAASRRTPRPPANPLPYLLGGLSRARRGR